MTGDRVVYLIVREGKGERYKGGNILVTVLSYCFR